jgi:hypothetical protein
MRFECRALEADPEIVAFGHDAGQGRYPWPRGSRFLI